LDWIVKLVHGEYLINKLCNNKDAVCSGEIKNNFSEEHKDENMTAPHCIGCLEDPVRKIDEWKRNLLDNSTLTVKPSQATEDSFDIELETNQGEEERNTQENMPSFIAEKSSKIVDNKIDKFDGKINDEKSQLVRMGFNTALAITLHNIPEGLATFFGASDDPVVGTAIAVAISLHNIPEGLCVALPIYYATGNKKLSFLWGALSGVSEPIVALIVWGIVKNSLSEGIYAVMFGLVSGMMVTISVKELLPTAHRFDPNNSVVTYSFIGGMLATFTHQMPHSSAL